MKNEFNVKLENPGLPCIYCLVNGDISYSVFAVTGVKHKSSACMRHGDIIKKISDLDIVYLPMEKQ